MTRGKLRPPFTPKEAREIGRKGGIAAGKSKAARRALREELQAILDQVVTGPDGEPTTRRARISVALIKKAEAGDVKAFKAIAETIGEKSPMQIEVKAHNDVEVSLGDMDVDTVAAFLADVKKRNE